MTEIEQFLAALTAMGCPYEREDGDGGDTAVRIGPATFQFVSVGDQAGKFAYLSFGSGPEVVEHRSN